MAIGKAAPALAAAPPPPPATTYLSLAPNTFVQGGLIDDIDVEFTDALTCEYDYNGTTAPGPALAIEMTDVNGAAHVQYYSAGKPEDWKPTEDGCGFASVSGKTAFNNSCNLAMFMDALAKASFPMELLATGNVKCLIGTKAHVLQKQTERKGLIRTGKNADRVPSILLVSKINSMPGTEAPAAATPAAKPNGSAAATASAPASGSANDLDDTIIGAINNALMEAGDGAAILKKDIAKVVFQAYSEAKAAPAERNKAVVRAGSQEFLKSLADQGIEYDGTQIKFAVVQ